MTVSGGVTALATRIATEVKGKAPTNHTHAAATRTVSYASSVTVTAQSGIPVDRVNISATGNITVSLSGSTDGQIIRLNVLGVSGSRTITINSAVRTSTSLTRTIVVPSGEVAMIAFEFSSILASGSGAWVMTAATVSAT